MLAEGESITAECNGIMVMKWRDKREVSFIFTFHDNTMQTQSVRGTMDMKDQMVQPYLVERK
jgi:hypothetical protein